MSMIYMYVGATTAVHKTAEKVDIRSRRDAVGIVDAIIARTAQPSDLLGWAVSWSSYADTYLATR